MTDESKPVLGSDSREHPGLWELSAGLQGRMIGDQEDEWMLFRHLVQWHMESDRSEGFNGAYYDHYPVPEVLDEP